MNSRYQILRGNDAGHLEKQVNDAMNTGWELAGMAFVSDGKFYQPMEKKTAAKSLAVTKKETK